MTIVHVIPFLWSGAGQVLTRLCQAQREHAQVHVVTSGHSRGLSDWVSYRRRLRDAGVRLHKVDTFDRTAEAFWAAVEQLTNLLAELRPDVVHAHAGVPALACRHARARLPRAAPALVAHMYSWGTGRPRWMDVMDGVGFACADATICSARAYQRILRNHGVPASRLHYVPWGVDTPDEVRQVTRSVPPEGGVIGIVGRIEPRKRQQLLVQAMAHLVGTRPLSRLDIIGPAADLAYAADVRDDIAKLGLRLHVRLRGHVRAIGPALGALDLLVSLSRDEGQGMAILEAMAAGVPVAATRSAGVEDYLVANRTGMVIAAETPRAIGATLDRALADPERLGIMARRASRMVQRTYAWRSTIRRIDEIYAACLQRRP